MSKDPNVIYGTTILCLKKDNSVVIAADGQVTLGSSVVKATAMKLRSLNEGKIVAGFAGSTADGLTLFERLEARIEKHKGNLSRAVVELTRDWRTDKYLRRLEAMLLVADKDHIFTLSGAGDVIEPESNVAAIGSGGNFALAAASALIDVPKMSAKEIAQKAMNIAGQLCIYSNTNINFLEIK